ncbi:hypothetical protein L3X38_041193 [Prunus dulcis]|uniref:Uncharacterized protein n=1 Tax=Prunus dulcis TaxID=3755 RepID=A0AAD4USJ2_PRUDU|nr:hypothetical protein L3X38_041193 [Prunus dulcis]
MIGSKSIRSKTAVMAQSMIAQRHSSHDLAVDVVARPPHAFMNPKQNIVAAPQLPPLVAGTTMPPVGPTVVVRPHGPTTCSTSQSPTVGTTMHPHGSTVMPLPPSHLATVSSNPCVA